MGEKVSPADWRLGGGHASERVACDLASVSLGAPIGRPSGERRELASELIRLRVAAAAAARGAFLSLSLSLSFVRPF